MAHVDGLKVEEVEEGSVVDGERGPWILNFKAARFLMIGFFLQIQTPQGQGLSGIKKMMMFIEQGADQI